MFSGIGCSHPRVICVGAVGRIGHVEDNGGAGVTGRGEIGVAAKEDGSECVVSVDDRVDWWDDGKRDS